MARLDRLGAAEEAAQIGAAIGREFSHALLAGVALKSEAELESALDRLIEAGLLSRQGAPPQASYLFKHTLVRDAAYGTLLRARASARASRPYRRKQPWSANSARSPIANREILARHCTEAGLSREGRGTVGQGGTAFARPLGADRSLSPTRPGHIEQIVTLPDTPTLRREPDRTSRSRSCSTYPCQWVRRARNQGRR